ncbi:MAG: biotin/lipoyl-binding protein [Cellulosilyticaceae bacterium]
MKKFMKYMALGLGGVILLSGCDAKAPQPDVAENAVSVPSTVTEATGKVVVEESASIYLDFPATITEVVIKEGDKVKKGDVLLRLDTTEYSNLLNQKINEKSLYMLEMEGLQQVAYPQSPHISQLTSNLRLKETALLEGTDGDLLMLDTSLQLAKDEKAELSKDYQTAKELVALGGMAQKDLTKLEQGLRTANKAIDDLEVKIGDVRQAKEDEVEAVKAQIKDLQTQIGNASSSNSTSQEKLALQIQTVDLQIEAMETKLKKPYIQGNDVIATEDNLLIYDLAVEQGTKTEGLMGPAFKTKDMTKCVVEADIPEEYSDQLQVGSTVSIIPYVDEEQRLQGTVVRIREQVVDNYGEGVVKMIIEVEDSKGLLRLGSSVDIEF